MNTCQFNFLDSKATRLLKLKVSNDQIFIHGNIQILSIDYCVTSTQPWQSSLMMSQVLV